MLIAIQQREIVPPVMLDTIPTEVSAHYALPLQIVLFAIQQQEIVPPVMLALFQILEQPDVRLVQQYLHVLTVIQAQENAHLVLLDFILTLILQIPAV